MEKLSDRDFWDEEWKKENRQSEEKFIKNYIFNPLFQKYLPYGGTLLEVGCAPGTIMANFSINFGYHVTGIDYSSCAIVKETLSRHNISDYELYEVDFTEFQTDLKFDVVCSFGLVEHFTDYNGIIQKHASLVKENGYVIIEVPNIRYFNYLLFRIFNPKLLKLHNLKIMEKNEISRAIRALPDFEILYCNYYKSCFLFFNSENSELTSRPILKKSITAVKWLFQKLGLEKIPNKYFSPYLVLIAKRSNKDNLD